MKKTLVLSCCIVALCACKAEIEKDISLKALLNEPIKVESGILNVEIATCSSHEDSRKPSDALIQIQQKIPNVFDNAVYKECYQKNFNSFASFEIPIAVGKLDDSSEIKHNVNIYSYKNHYLNVQTSDKLAKNIRDFMDREYLSDLALSLTLKINNDTNQALDVTFISAYVNDSPVDFLPLTFKQGESIEVKLSNAS
ncbi:DUF7424 family protein [Pasteurella multocida]|nr:MULTISPECIES: hypothetical protein [Pasteurella]MCL7851235.1 hypothetical protein [Pasteurella multocida]QIC08748.1 hypothetical protein PmVP161_0278 [Pasteurella multocida]TAA83333.1 hypothetical protein PMCNC_15530 [Pasteurella multocida]TAA88492.1 hypothetical protein PMCNA_14970 [Pasteurella multocida]WGE13627.1 hypothetical protein PM3_0255 [Pasteurella multocida]